MKISVNASRSYDIHLGNGILHSAGQLAAQNVSGRLAALISDSNVAPLYAGAVEQSLKDAGFSVVRYDIDAGEQSKNGQNYLKLCSQLAKDGISRSDVLIALGGGVVGDLVGFLAATFLRGIAFLQVPTSLLAMVDSSVGGKTAIDLPEGKNLVGAFYQPCAVICDLDTLSTLPHEQFLSGCGEILKYAVLSGGKLYSHLLEHGEHFDRQTVIAQCVQIKRDIVERDEHEQGERRLLNLGHTPAHALELCSQFELFHGNAVATGLCIIANGAKAQGLCSAQTANDICTLVARFGLSTKPQYPPQLALPHIFSDKKRSGGQITLIIPRSIGDCIPLKMPIEQANRLLESGMEHCDG